MNLESHEAIVREADRMLRRSRARGVFPTPVDEIVATAKLAQPERSLLAQDVIDEAPAHLRRVMRRLAGRVRGLLDRRTREVHLDPELPTAGRRRFTLLHEVGHHVLPWQAELAYADDDATLSLMVKTLFEREASVFAAEVLFQGNRFAEDTAEIEIGLAAVSAGCNQFGASLRAGLRRYVETHRAPVLGLVLEPHPEPGPSLRYRRHEVSVSSAYLESFGQARFPQVLEADHYSFVIDAYQTTHVGRTTRTEPLPGEWLRTDLVGGHRAFRTEVLASRYAVLVLAWLPTRQVLKQKLRLVQAS